MGPSGGIPPGDAGGIWVRCNACGQVSRKRNKWSAGCPREECDGGPDDIVLTSRPVRK